MKKPLSISAEAISHLPDPLGILEEIMDSARDPEFDLVQACTPCHKWDAEKRAREKLKGNLEALAAFGEPPSPPGAVRPTVNCWGCHYAYLQQAQIASLEGQIRRLELLRETWAENFREIWRSRNRRRAWGVIQLLRSIDRRLAELEAELEPYLAQQRANESR